MALTSIPAMCKFRPRSPRRLPYLGVIALFPRRMAVSLGKYGCLQGVTCDDMVEVPNNHHVSHQRPLYGPCYTDKGPVDNHLAALGRATLRPTRPRCAPAGSVAPRRADALDDGGV